MDNNTTAGDSQFPVIPLWEDILVVPIVGSMDSNRTKNLMETLLKKTRSTGAKVVIIDLSGVSVMDTEVSKRLMDLGEAVRLLGANYKVCGLQPNQTHSLVDLGIDLGNIDTHHDLSSALTDGLESLNINVDPGNGDLR